MGTRKVTITIEDEQLAAVKALVRQGRAKSLSGFVQAAVDLAVDTSAGWGAMLTDALKESGGPLGREEQAWVDAAVARVAAPKQRKAVKTQNRRSPKRAA